MSLAAARAVADAVLYEGYLLYPYRASSSKNRSRWQFGVLGPPHATASAFGEPPSMAMQCLLTPGGQVTVHLRFLHLQVRVVESRLAATVFVPVPALTVGDETILSWDEAVEHEITLPPGATDYPVFVPGAQEISPLPASSARIVRRRQPLTARVRVSCEPCGDLQRLTVTVTNEHPSPVTDKETAVQHSLLSAHVLIEAHDASFVSVIDPPPSAAIAASRCKQDRCWPVLAGPPGSDDVLFGAPIILYDHPEIAAESPGALFDLTEIDEILTLRVMTMTDAEKAEARATDTRARAIIDRCDALPPAALAQLHGTRRDRSSSSSPDVNPAGGASERRGEPPVGPGSTRGDSAVGADGSRTGSGFDFLARRADSAGGSRVDRADPGADVPTFGDAPWWDPAADASVDPGRDTVDVGGVRIGRDSLVLLRPSRRADAQDLFLAGRLARVTAVLSDVDGETHVAVVLTDDPAADLHEWYGRYYYFAPDELEPAGPASGGENQS